MPAPRFEIVPAYLPPELYLRRLERVAVHAHALEIVLDARAPKAAVDAAREKLKEALAGLVAPKPAAPKKRRSSTEL